MAKSQKKSNREVRKPKAEKPKPGNASNPSTKPVELFATLALALSTLVAVTVVSIGIVRAEGLTARSQVMPLTVQVRSQ